MVTPNSKRLRQLLAESDLVPPVRFRVGDRTLTLSHPCRTAAQAIDAARDLGATRIDFILSDRSHIEFRQHAGHWRALDWTTLEDAQRLLDRASVGAIAGRAEASQTQEHDSRSLSGRHARRDLVELNAIQDPDLFAQAADSILSYAAANAAYRHALCRAAVPGAPTSQQLVLNLLQRMTGDAAKRSRGQLSAALLPEDAQASRHPAGSRLRPQDPDVAAHGGPPRETQAEGGSRSNAAEDTKRGSDVHHKHERHRNG